MATTCKQCDKDIKHEGPFCKSCHRNIHCLRCKASPKLIKSLCLECWRLWESLLRDFWQEFLEGRTKA